MAADPRDHRPSARREPSAGPDDRAADSPAGELPARRTVAAAVELFSAIAHPVRLLVLVALHRRGPLSAGDLQTLAGVEQTALSHQLRILRHAHLVSSRRRGRQVIYALRDHHVAHIVSDALAHVTEDPGRG